MKKLIFVLLCCFTLSGCGNNTFCSERIVLNGRRIINEDNIILIAPDGYFLNMYEWNDVDGHTKQLIITLTDNKRLGEK